MSDYDENKESSYIIYWDVSNFYGWSMLQRLPTFNFEWIKDISQFIKIFITKYDEKKRSRLYS